MVIVEGPFRVLVAGLHQTLTDSDVRPIFQAFGDLGTQYKIEYESY